MNTQTTLTSRTLALLATAFLAALTRCAPQTAVPPDTALPNNAAGPQSTGLVALPSTAQLPIATPPAPSVATTGPLATTTPGLPKPIEDLLRVTEATVTVSSTVPRGPNFPEDLVDDDFATAWQSDPEDDSPTIRIVLPKDAQLESIELSAGYTTSLGERHWFTKNPRITELSVRHGGQEVGRFSLDPKLRELQTLAVHGDGGIYELQVTGTVRGSRKQSQGVTVSELRVMGRAGAESHPPARPWVVVEGQGVDRVIALNDSLKTLNVEAEAAAPTLAALCGKLLAQAPESVTTPEGSLTQKGQPRCARIKSQALPRDATYRGLTWAQTYDGYGHNTRLALRLPSGYTWLPFSFGEGPYGIPGSADEFHPDELTEVRIENGYLVLGLDEHYECGTGDKEVRVGVLWCKAQSAALACRLFDPTIPMPLGEYHIDKNGLIRPHN